MNHPFPSPFLRFSAYVIDLIVLYSVGIIVIPFSALGYEDIGANIATVLLIPIAIYQLYLVTTTGQTLGKKACKIRIVKWSDGSKAGFLHGVFLRRIIHVLNMTGIVPIADFASIVFTPSRRALHDYISGTVVVHHTNEELPPNIPVAKRSKPAIIAFILVLVVPIILLVGFFAHAVITAETAPDKHYSNPSFSLEYPAFYSLDTSEVDSTSGPYLFEGFGSWFRIETGELGWGTEIDFEALSDQFQSEMLQEMDTIIPMRNITQYGSYPAEGTEFKITADDDDMRANVYLVQNSNNYVYIVEFYADMFSRRSIERFEAVQQSISLIDIDNGFSSYQAGLDSIEKASDSETTKPNLK